MVIEMNPWKRDGLVYIYRREWIEGPIKHTLVRKLDFVTYHLIKWIHGESKLIEMAEDPLRV
jgi:hypothetical protein